MKNKIYLREFRRYLKLSQKELSDILEIAQTTIARYENDQIKPTSTILMKYINRLNANPFYLFTGAGPFFLDEQYKVNKENLICIKKKELKDLQDEEPYKCENHKKKE